MDTNVQALKELYVSLGGKASDVANLATSSEVITAMKSVAASAASELPKPKSSNNNKIATVVKDGDTYKWSAVDQLSVYKGVVNAQNVFTLDSGSPTKNLPTGYVPMFLLARMQDNSTIMFNGMDNPDLSAGATFTAVTRGTNSTTYHTIKKAFDWEDRTMNNATYTSVTIPDPT